MSTLCLAASWVTIVYLPLPYTLLLQPASERCPSSINLIVLKFSIYTASREREGTCVTCLLWQLPIRPSELPLQSSLAICLLSQVPSFPSPLSPSLALTKAPDPPGP